MRRGHRQGGTVKNGGGLFRDHKIRFVTSEAVRTGVAILEANQAGDNPPAEGIVQIDRALG